MGVPLERYVRAISRYDCRNPNDISIKFPQRTVEPRFNEPLYNKVLGITNDMFEPSNSVMYGTEPRYNKPISPVPWHFRTDRKLSFSVYMISFLINKNGEPW